MAVGLSNVAIAIPNISWVEELSSEMTNIITHFPPAQKEAHGMYILLNIGMDLKGKRLFLHSCNKKSNSKEATSYSLQDHIILLLASRETVKDIYA